MARLTDWDELNVEACVLWWCAIRKAVLDAELDVRAGLGRLAADRRAYWEARINEAESQPPRAFERGNGFVVTALQAAWAAIVQTPVPEDDPSQHLADALAAAVRIGQDTDTVACIAGQLLGARWGASAGPGEWRRVLHGYPGIGGDDLVEVGRKALRA
ncbi:ADP-ribosylglycohydrolase family protein [Luteococcus sanguinis]|uniref:ADP-ribosylglycohydrolase family protein n=1 Tax=Luteococcus sanguinis TaxID=174038 RepID=A0ABW1WZD5_9ACTN